MTHRKETETIDPNGKLTARSATNTVFKGDLQYGPKIDKMYATSGTIDTGDGLLFVAPNDDQASLITPRISVIVEGTTSGSTYAAWEVIGLINAPEVQGSVDHYLFHVRKVTPVTL